MPGDSYAAAAVREAKRRFTVSTRLRRRQRYGHGMRKFGEELGSCAAEALVSAHLGLPYEPSQDPASDRERGDLTNGDEVRWTRHRRGGLILHPADVDDRRFWLVVGPYPDLRIVGSMLARDGKQEQWWGEPYPGRPCFLVPQDVVAP